MSARNVFVSYATGCFIPARDSLCHSARQVGFDEVRPRSRQDLDPAFTSAHHAILSDDRGAGYWLWKPQLILQELQTLKPGDLLVYSDAGRSPYYRFRRFPLRLAQKARSEGFLLGPTIGQHGPMSKWTKRDAFVLMGMDEAKVHSLAPIQATWSFWTPVPAAFDFLEAWLANCSDPRILTDMANTQGLPNLPDFFDHRHDQSVLTLLACRSGAPYMELGGSVLDRVLRLRPQSRLAHLFLKRIDDAEGVSQDRPLRSLVRAALDIYKMPHQLRSFLGPKG